MSAIEIQQHCAYDKQLIITLLTEHWEEFLDILNGTYQTQTIDTFPPVFYEFAHLLLRSLQRTQTGPHATPQEGNYQSGTQQDMFTDFSLHTTGLLQKAYHLQERTKEDSTPHNTIINDNGIFVIQRDSSYTTFDQSFQNLVDSVLS
ncbi:MAG: hypothetical protein ACTTJ7_03170 [Treponema sp.]